MIRPEIPLDVARSHAIPAANHQEYIDSHVEEVDVRFSEEDHELPKFSEMPTDSGVITRTEDGHPLDVPVVSWQDDDAPRWLMLRAQSGLLPCPWRPSESFCRVSLRKFTISGHKAKYTLPKHLSLIHI